jgi:hypothetical protein
MDYSELAPLENYFNYFTEIEEHFQRRRGSILMLSTLDWALIETWKEAGIPLEAVLRGIDATFDHHEQRPSKTRKINGLGFCSQEVLAAAEAMKEASVGTARDSKPNKGFDPSEIATFLRHNAAQLEQINLPSTVGISPRAIADDTSGALKDLAAGVESSSSLRLEDLERRLTVLEEKLFAVLLAAIPDDEVVEVRAQADRELTAYRNKMPAAQVEQLRKQFVHKRLLEKYGVPRLSLFYM